MGIVEVYLSVNRKPPHPTQVRCKAGTKKPSRHARNRMGYGAEKVRIPPIQEEASTRIQTFVCDSAEQSYLTSPEKRNAPRQILFIVRSVYSHLPPHQKPSGTIPDRLQAGLNAPRSQISSNCFKNGQYRWLRIRQTCSTNSLYNRQDLAFQRVKRLISNL